MYENDSKHESDTELNVNHSDTVHDIYFDFTSKRLKNLTSSLLDENESVYFQQYLHRHNSKCFITSVFLHAINFILKKRSANVVINLPNDNSMKNIYLTDDGYVDDYLSSDRWSTGSDRSRVVSSTRSSEGFQEMDGAIGTNINLNKLLIRFDYHLRLSLCANCISLPKLSEVFYQSLENVLDNFQNKYNSCQWLGPSVSELNKLEMCRIPEELCKIYETIFKERINWSRIVVMIGFVCELALCALNTDRVELIEQYIATSVCFIDDNLKDWIVDHGGWEGLVDFNVGQREDGDNLNNIFGNMGRITVVLVLALAGVIFCRYVADHI